MFQANMTSLASKVSNQAFALISDNSKKHLYIKKKGNLASLFRIKVHNYEWIHFVRSSSMWIHMKWILSLSSFNFYEWHIDIHLGRIHFFPRNRQAMTKLCHLHYYFVFKCFWYNSSYFIFLSCIYSFFLSLYNTNLSSVYAGRGSIDMDMNF